MLRGSSSAKKRNDILATNIQRQSSRLKQLEERLQKLETSAKTCLQQLTHSSRKSTSYLHSSATHSKIQAGTVDLSGDINSVRKNLFETTLKYLQPQRTVQIDKLRNLNIPKDQIQFTAKKQYPPISPKSQQTKQVKPPVVQNRSVSGSQDVSDTERSIPSKYLSKQSLAQQVIKYSQENKRLKQDIQSSKLYKGLRKQKDLFKHLQRVITRLKQNIKSESHRLQILKK